MPVAKEQIRQIISENNPAGADGGRTGCNSWLREKP